MKNLGLLYNKLFYTTVGDLIQVDLKRRDALLQAEFCPEQARDPVAELKAYCGDRFRSFRMETSYPGMLIGAGAPHGGKDLKDDLMLGFSFDYTTGQPYIPGSSVKGVLRSHFKDRPKAVAGLLTAISGTDVDTDTVAQLETAVFEEDNVFFDAGVVSGDDQNCLLAKDYITPHPSPLKEPIPIPFLKIRPGVRFEFRFLICDAALSSGKTVPADQLKTLFIRLLEFFGVGAKTNVGYGALCEVPGA